MEFREYYQIIRDHIALPILGLVLSVGLVITLYSLVGPSWEAHGQLLVSPEAMREPAATGEERAPTQPVRREVFLDNFVVYVQSAVVRQRAAHPNTSAESREFWRDRAQPVLPMVVQANVVGRTNYIEVIGLAPSARDAQAVCFADMQAAIKSWEEQSQRSTERVRNFIGDRVREARMQFQDASLRLAGFEGRERVQEPVLLSSRLLEREANLLNLQLAAEADLNSETARLPVLTSLAAGRAATLVTQTTQAINPLTVKLRSDLADLEVRMAAELKTRTTEHPAVRQLQTQIQDIQQRLQREEAEITTGRTEALDTPRLALTEQALTAQTQVRGLRARLSSIQQDLSQVRAQLASLPFKRAEYTRLATERDVALASYQRLQQQLDLAKIEVYREAKSGAISITDPGTLLQRSGLALVLRIGVAMIAGLGGGVLLAFVFYFLDTSFRTESEVERALGVRVIAGMPESDLAYTPEMQQLGLAANVLGPNPASSAFLEAYRVLRSSVLIEHSSQPFQVLLVTSAEAGDGKTNVAINLGTALAATGQNVIVVDGDIRHPTVAETLGVRHAPGVLDVCAGTEALEDAVVDTAVPRLRALPGGRGVGRAPDVLDVGRLGSVLAQLRGMAEFVIVDSPPLGPFADAAAFATVCDATLFVLRAGRPRSGLEERALSTLDSLNVRVLGIVLNNMRPKDSVRYQHYYRYLGAQPP